MLLHNESQWEIHKFSTNMLHRFSGETLLAVSECWNPSQKLVPMVCTWLDIDPRHTAIITSFFDPSRVSIDMFGEKYHDRIKIISNFDLCFWLIAVDRYFLKYSIEEVTPTDFQHHFLCYQRKSNPVRELLYETLKNKTGIITIGTKKFADINSDIPKHIGLDEIDGELEVGNDIYSLGNIKIWNSSFLNIVSETQQNLTTKSTFVSEKIFKPIIGLRPFLCYGHPETSKLLIAKGFETFDEDFGYVPTNCYRENAKQLAAIVDNIDNPRDMFNKLLPKLIYNKQILQQLATSEQDKIESLRIIL
jgi:hypothetical protein